LFGCSDRTYVVWIYRSADEVFKPETIASFQGKSITIRHPDDFVAPKNWKDLTKGTVQNVRRGESPGEDGEEVLLADLLITEHMAIQLVKNGLREVSCGYECEYEQTSDGKGRQFNIIGNHCALVEEGRAGPAYAINDHKGKVNMDPKKLVEKLKARFGAKVIDEAMAEEKKESKDEDKSMDAGAAYDELVKMVKDMSEKLDGMKAGKDEDKEDKSKDEDKKDDDKEDESKDEDAGMEERLKALELAVKKLLEAKAGDEDEDGEEMGDEEKESEDDDFEESSMTGDSKSRAEILAPGIKASKDLEAKALQAAYATKEGKAVIDSLTGGKKLTMLFIAASEMLKSSRGNGLSGTKRAQAQDAENQNELMTAEKMNEINKAHWARK
jgi:hypothetical protein